MRLSDSGLGLIQRFEGFCPFVYLDAAELPTIGYGHLIKAGENFSRGIDVVNALELLRADVRISECAVLKFISVQLTQSQFDALVSFTFNLGSGVLQRSTLRRVINRELYEEAPAQLMRYVWAGGKKLSGLVRRRKAEADLFLS